MTQTDDIKGIDSGGLTEKTDQEASESPVAPPEAKRTISPESEVRGGPEAPPDPD